MLAIAQPLGISTPIAATSLPLSLYVNGNDLANVIDKDSWSLVDNGFGAPQQLAFKVLDRSGNAGQYLIGQALVQWMDNVNNRMLYQGFIKDIQIIDQAIYPVYTVVCNDLSEGLDFGRPIIAVDIGRHSTTDQGQIQVLMAGYSYYPFDTSAVQMLQSAMPATNELQMLTLRAGIESILALTGVPNATYYVDAYGRLHTITTGDAVAPFTISD